MATARTSAARLAASEAARWQVALQPTQELTGQWWVREQWHNRPGCAAA